MNYRIVNGSISYGAETILEEINFEIKEKDKIAIVGRNGSGKSTLLNAIVDNSMLEEGIGEEKFNVYKQGNPIIGFLKQMEFEDSSTTLIEEILKVYEPILNLEDKIAKLANEMQDNTNQKLIKEYTEALDKFNVIGGYTYKKEYEVALKKFGFTEEDKSKTMDQFSGGQRTKVAFLKLLLSKPDILLLDEPTNHLDITAIEWLENYLKNYTKSVVIVSHDRMFLDRIVNKVYEIEYATMTEYIGNYTEFEKQKRINYEKQLKDYEYQQAEIKRLQAIADRFRYKPTKAKMALSKLKKIEQMQIIEEPNKYDLKTFHLNFNIKMESGKSVLDVKDLEIGYDKPIQKVSFNLYKGQKLAIIGENGIGKSTLLKTLNGNIPKIDGSFEYGYHVDRQYFDQQIEFKNPENTVFDDFYETFPELTTTQIRTILGTFLFSGEDVFKKIKVLSGGERARLQLCKIFKKGPNLLLLDEPTNHMDIIGKESLENILKEYKGTLIFVSHDRYFVNKIADSLLVFKPGNVIFFDGIYEEYEEKYREYEDDVSYMQEGNNLSNQKPLKDEKYSHEKLENAKSNNQYFINKEIKKAKAKIEKLEQEINKLEAEIANLKQEMSKEEYSTDYLKLKDLQEEIDKINATIEEKMTEWDELNEMVDKNK